MAGPPRHRTHNWKRKGSDLSCRAHSGDGRRTTGTNGALGASAEHALVDRARRVSVSNDFMLAEEAMEAVSVGAGASSDAPRPRKGEPLMPRGPR